MSEIKENTRWTCFRGNITRIGVGLDHLAMCLSLDDCVSEETYPWATVFVRFGFELMFHLLLFASYCPKTRAVH
jgi:hypothetical protein